MKELQTDLLELTAEWVKEKQIEEAKGQALSSNRIQRFLEFIADTKENLYKKSLRKETQKLNGELYSITPEETRRAKLILAGGTIAVVLVAKALSVTTALDTYKHELIAQDVTITTENQNPFEQIAEDWQTIVSIWEEKERIKQEQKENPNLVNHSISYVQEDVDGLIVMDELTQEAINNLIEDKVNELETKGRTR